jgi:hypothetical protein
MAGPKCFRGKLVKIDPEFQNLLPPHTPEELEQLTENCKADPWHEIMPPVQIWENGGGIVLDGHNQLRIRNELQLSVKKALLDFDTREEALQYSISVQLGRRNLDASQRAILYARYPRFAHGGDRKSGDQDANLHLDALAKAAGVSERTMQAAAKVADRGAACVIEGVRAGAFSASDAAKVVELPREVQSELVESANRNGTTLSQARRISGGIAFNPAELEQIPTRKPPKNGSSVVPGKAKVQALEHVSALCRALKKLDLFDEFNPCLSQVIRRVKELK